MAVPSTFADLSVTPASNSGLIDNSTNVNEIDNHLQTVYALIASIYANSGNGWSSPWLTAANPSYTGTLTGGTGVVNLGSGQFYKSAGGNVGIGTASPAQALHVVGSTTTLRVDGNSATPARLELSSAGIVSWSIRANAYSGGELSIGPDASPQAVTLTSSGNVGIGTASLPAGRRLAVAGGAVRFDNDAQLEWGGSSAGVYGNSASNYFVFFTNTTERMRIDASGNLAIANTGSAPATPASGGVLYVEGGALKFRGSSGSITILAPA